jgi:hypothetical protein
VPVNPACGVIGDVPCHARFDGIPGGAESVLLVTPPALTSSMIRMAVGAGARRIWVYRRGRDRDADDAISLCRENAVDIIDGGCPLLFLPGAGFPHNVHTACLKLIGRYPAGVHSAA